MTPREFRQEQDLEFDHFTELTSTGIKPNYANIELFAQEYHKAKLKLLTIPVVGSSNNFKKTLVSKDVGTFFLTDKEVEVWEKNGNIKTGDILYRTVTDTLY